jgi:RNA polymerase sigma-70 factor (ECF subfamily)
MLLVWWLSEVPSNAGKGRQLHGIAHADDMQGTTGVQVECGEAHHGSVLAVGRPSWRPALSQPPDLERIFLQYVDPIYRFFYRRVGNHQDAEDLTSEVFLKAAHQLDATRAAESIRSWLFTVARTVLSEHWRRYYRAGSALPLDEAEMAETSGAISGRPHSETERLVADVLSALPERYRQVLELRFLRGYSMLETAEELGLTLENVKVIQHRALAKAAEIAGDRL